MAKRRVTEVEELEDVESADEAAGTSVETVLIFATTVALLVGTVMGFLELGKHMGIGPFK